MSSADTDGTAVSGQYVGPYRLVRVLGRGGMGTVYLASAPDGDAVAIKVIKREVTRKPEALERFRREVIAARGVRPFCTAPVLDANLDHEPFYVVTEYIQGPTLERVVTAHGPLSNSDLEGLAVGVATALTAIHGAGVVHRDLKPENILLSPFGPRVIDFGIARRLGTDHPLTQDGDTMGTPSYLAPEGLTGQPITAAADLFAWGCVVAFAATGRLPFQGENIGEILYKTVHGPPQLDGLDHPRLRELVVRATSKNPLDRPTSAQLLQELTGQSDPGRVDLGRPVGDTTAPDAPVHRPAHDGFTKVALRSRGRGLARRRNLLALGGAILALGLAVPAVLWAVRSDDGPPTGKEVVSDDFSDSGSGWYAAAWPSYYVRYDEGVYLLGQHAERSYQPQAAPVGGPQASVTIKVTVDFRSDDPRDEAGVFCRSDGNAEYQFLLARNGFVRVRKANRDAGVQLAVSQSAVGKTDEPVRLQVACEPDGDTMRLRAWVEGRKALEATDDRDAYPAGKIGVVIGRENRGPGQSPTVAAFDDFSAQSL